MLITSLLVRWRFDAIKVNFFFTSCLPIRNSSSPLPYKPTNYNEQHDHNTRQCDYTSEEDALSIWWKKTNGFQTNYQTLKTAQLLCFTAMMWLCFVLFCCFFFSIFTLRNTTLFFNPETWTSSKLFVASSRGLAEIQTYFSFEPF